MATFYVNVLTWYIGHNDCWFNFCLDGFSLELLFAWIDFPGITFWVFRVDLFSWIANFGDYACFYFCKWVIFEFVQYLCNTSWGHLLWSSSFCGRLLWKIYLQVHLFSQIGEFQDFMLIWFYELAEFLLNKSAQNINQRKNWSTRKLIYLKYLSGSKFDRHCIRLVFTKRLTSCFNSLFWKETMTCTSLGRNLMVLKFFHQMTLAFNLICLNSCI